MSNKIQVPKNLSPMVADLRKNIAAEVYNAFGVAKIKIIHPFIEPIIYKPTQAFAKVGALLDDLTGKFDAITALENVVPFFVQDLQTNFQTEIPEEGPLLIISNHPGSVDSISLASVTNRKDIKIVAGAFPFLQRLPHVSDHLIFVPPEEDTFGRMRVIREMIRHLKAGGAVLIFPTGHIDPDPAFFPNPFEHIERWSRSLEIIIRNVPDVQILPAIASNFLSQKFLTHPITVLGKFRNDKQRIAEFLHIMSIMVTGKNLITGKISMGEAFQLSRLEVKSRDWFDKVLANSKTLLSQHVDLFPPETQFNWQERPYSL